MNEALLFSRGATLADVPPDFKGIPWERWLVLQVKTPERYSPEWIEAWERQAWPKKAPAEPRDNYGIKGAVGYRRHDL